jgi:CRP-like cAMP-binding protein
MVQIARLRNVEVFRGLPDEELQIVAGHCWEDNIPEGVTLCEEGAGFIRFKKGVKYTIQAAGRILGWSFLVPTNRHTASAVTVIPSKILGIKGPDFYDFVHRESKVGLRIMDNLAQVVSSRLKAFGD